MLCIAAFIVFAILGIFSATHRALALKAWKCVLRRVTLRPCDTTFGQEVKTSILKKVVFKYPKFAKVLDKWLLDLVAFVFVILSVWSLISVSLAGLNLWVYDTCNPMDSESCSLGGEACGIVRPISQMNFMEAWQNGRGSEWLASPFVMFAETVSRIPDRLKTWNPQDYFQKGQTFYAAEDSNKPYALEILDPSCVFCKQMFLNMKAVGFEQKYNLTYIPYPIPGDTESGYKFPHSVLLAKYLMAAKSYSVSFGGKSMTADWYLLEHIFTGTDASGKNWQEVFNEKYDVNQVQQELKSWLVTGGLTEVQIQELLQKVDSPEVAEMLKNNNFVVEQEVKTIKIPTILFDGRRFDRLISAEQLR